ncbi:MAG: sigma-70 family RNA polymerase sigma factor [Bacteroidetes bacterium]|nr:sigma-70 family RNA polymerase sigma factor [Bacteroidota bacterium]
MKQQITEQELITLVKSHSKEGFDLLYSSYAPAFYAVIFRTVKESALAEDLLQEVFVKIWRNIDKYDPGKSKLFTWMIRIAKNAAIDHMRTAAHKNLQATQDKVEDLEEMLKHKDREVDYGLLSVIERMEPKYKEAISTVFYDNYSHAEAADVLGLPLGTLKSRIRTALVMLRASLQLSVNGQNI